MASHAYPRSLEMVNVCSLSGPLPLTPGTWVSEPTISPSSGTASHVPVVPSKESRATMRQYDG